MMPSVPTLHRLALALGVSTDHLLGLGAEERPSRTPVPLDGDPALRRFIRRARVLNPARMKLLSDLAEALAETQ
jgi:hypothetical protein